MTRNKSTKSILTFAFALLLPVLCLCFIFAMPSAKASENNPVKSYSKFQDLTNSSFNSISSTYASNNVSGWSLIRENTQATTMIIDVEKSYSSYNARPYCISKLATNPGAKGADKKILMVNSANTNNNPSNDNYKAESKHEGYSSSDIKLAANSFYTFEASFKTMSFTNVSANPFASIYLSGLTDESGNSISLEYEMISSGNWSTVFFFVATGDTEQTVNLELWLGTNDQDSFGVAFFDEVYVQQFSENLFYENYYKDFYNQNNYYFNINGSNKDSNGNEYNYYSANKSYSNSNRPLVTLCELDEKNEIAKDINLDFEKNISASLSTLVDWKVAEGHTTDTNAQVIKINSEDSFKATVGNGYSYTGSTLSYSNNNALALWTNKGKSGTISLISKDIPIKAHECLKVSAFVKVSSLDNGNFELVVKENGNIYTDFSYLKNGSYKLMSTNTTVSSNGNDDFKNDYTQATIFIQGHDLYDSSFNILLSLGNEETLAEGCVIVDDIRVEKVGYDAYSKGSNKLKFSTINTDQLSTSIPNAFFNAAHSEDKVTSYPFTAEGWMVSKDSVSSGLQSGVVNFYEKYFNEFKSQNDWAKSFTNVGKNKTDSKNAFMFYNARNSYQSIKSSEFNISKNTYYSISLDYITLKTIANQNANLSIDVYTSENVLIYTDTLNSAGNWDKYNAYIYAGDSNLSVYVVLSFGKNDATCQGITYIDAIKLETSNEEIFSNAIKKSDLSNFMLNLDPTNTVGENITSSLAYSGASTKTDAGIGGVIIGKGNQSFGYIKDGKPEESIDDGTLTNNVLVINTTAPTSYTLTSNFDLSLNATTYYKLTFRLLTSLPEKDEKAEEDSNAYGVSIGLKDLDLAENLVFNDGWTECTLYFYNANSETLDTQLVFTLTSLTQDNTGYAYLTDLTWTEASDDNNVESSFTNAENDKEYGKTVFTSTYEVVKDEDEKDEDETDNDTTTDETNNSNNTLTILLSVSSIITFVAILIAVIGFYMRKMKIKKIQKVKSEDYDRKVSIDNSIIVNEANRIKKEKEEELETEINKHVEELKALEAKQKENIALSRKQNGKITKDIEKEFKTYASKRNKIQERLNILNEELENINSPEYMISLQKKITNQLTKAKKDAQKQVKKKSDKK